MAEWTNTQFGRTIITISIDKDLENKKYPGTDLRNNDNEIGKAPFL